MTNANSEQVVNPTVEGDVTDIVFKADRNGKEFVTVSIQQANLDWPTNVRSRDTEIIQRMVNVKKHTATGTTVWLRFEVKESPRAEGGVFRDITRLLRASLDGTPQEPETGGTRPAPAPTAASWGTLDERIAWNSAVNNAVTLTAHKGTLTTWLEEVDLRAQLLYPLIRRGPLPPADAPQRPVQDPDPNVDPEPDIDYSSEDGAHSGMGVMEV